MSGPFADLRNLWKFGWWARLDSLGHSLHLPEFLQAPLCDRFEKSLDDSFWVEPPTLTYTSSSATPINVSWTWSRSKRGRFH